MKTKLLIIVSLIAAVSAYAGSATWNLNPVSDDWTDPLNWTPNTIPNGEADVATFDASNLTEVDIVNTGKAVDHVAFTSTASPYTITVGPQFNPTLTLNGLGIVNNSGLTQNLIAGSGTIEFHNGSSAGTDTVFTTESINLITGKISFFDTSSAGNATFIVHDPVLFDDDSTAGNATFSGDKSTTFIGNSSAANATIILEGGVGTLNFGGFLSFKENATGGSANILVQRAATFQAIGAKLALADNSTAGHATITAEGGSSDGLERTEITLDQTASAGDAVITLEGGLQSGVSGANIFFNDSTSAGNSVLVAESGPGSGSGSTIKFVNKSSGGTARLELLGPVSGGGTLTIKNYGSSSFTVGSIEGGGLVVLGSKNLTVGTNNLSTTFSGTIQDSGSITKIGTGTFTLTGANTYTGGTTVTSGVLLVSNASGSGTGTGAVMVNGGTLGGSGIISGAVAVGTNTNTASLLAPSKGAKRPATLAIQGSLAFNDDSTYLYKLDTKHRVSDQVLANGVTIDDGAKFSLRASGTTQLPLGQVFTVISDTAASAISGRFHNLADGAIVNVNSNKLQATYSGGDGNDLTLTVVP
jgi:autotransporter-associated beta strand protein